MTALQIIEEQKAYRRALEEQAGFSSDMAKCLAKSAAQYIARRESTGGDTILAGFPFFEDWGRNPCTIRWTTTLTPPYKRCKYYFELRTEEEVWYYFEDGFLTEEQINMEGRMLQCFTVPWMNPADVNRTPEWVNDTVWYQIFPDRFCNGTPEKNGPDVTPWQIGKVGDTRDGRFYSFAFADWMPKLNTNNEEVIDYFGRVCEGWIRKYDIDGIRFDVGNEVSHRFLKQMRERLKRIKPDIYLLGEIWHDASQWLAGDEYDSVMNYPLMCGIHDFFLDQTMGKEEFEYMVNRCYTMYMQQSNNVLFTLPGSPCIYYGTEIAMEGGFDPDCRRCMPWGEIGTEENQERIGQMQTLIRLRKTEETFRSLHFHFPGSCKNRRCVEYIKLDEAGRRIEVLLNCSEDKVEVKGTGEVLFARNYQNGILEKNGTLIRRI